jgi:hypothetical protein
VPNRGTGGLGGVMRHKLSVGYSDQEAPLRAAVLVHGPELASTREDLQHQAARVPVAHLDRRVWAATGAPGDRTGARVTGGTGTLTAQPRPYATTLGETR